jgi:hypothetical protein
MRKLMWTKCIQTQGASVSEYTASAGRTISELEWISKEAILAWFDVLSRHLRGETEGTARNIRIAGVRSKLNPGILQ